MAENVHVIHHHCIESHTTQIYIMIDKVNIIMSSNRFYTFANLLTSALV